MVSNLYVELCGMCNAEVKTRKSRKKIRDRGSWSCRLDGSINHKRKVYKPVLNMMVSVLVEKAMAPHSSTLAWKIPWMEEPGRLQSMGSLRVRHD